MGLVHQKYKVAVVQAAPVFLDLDATVDKTIALIEENHNVFVPEGNLYVAPWNGSTWAALGGR